MRQTVELIVVALPVRAAWCGRFRRRPTSSRPARWPRRCWGWHREIICPNCRFVFVVGIDEEGQTGRAVCPNCGQRGLDAGRSIECGGDRVLVQKFIYDFRPPKRWEVAVFHFPGEPTPGLCQTGCRPAGGIDSHQGR